MAINGLSWPHTERHRPDAERLGALARDQHHRGRSPDAPARLLLPRRVEGRRRAATRSYTADQQRLAVTEVVNPFQTMSLSLGARRGRATGSTTATSPDHLVARRRARHRARRASMQTMLAASHVRSPAPDVRPGDGHSRRAERAASRAIDARRRGRCACSCARSPTSTASKPGYAFVLGGTPDEKRRDAMPVPGRRSCSSEDKPVAITVVNQSKDRAAVHWHGIELESYPDGVPGWSGSGKEILPSIAPGRFDHRALHAAARRHVHVPLALQRVAADRVGPVRADHRGRAGPEASMPSAIACSSSATAGSTDNVVVGPFAAAPAERAGAAEADAISRRARRIASACSISPTTGRRVITLMAGRRPARGAPSRRTAPTLPAVAGDHAAGNADVRSGRDLRLRVHADEGRDDGADIRAATAASGPPPANCRRTSRPHRRRSAVTVRVR